MRLASTLPSSEIFLFIQRLKSSFPLKQTATTTTSRGGQLYSEEANALAMDFNGITVDDGSDPDDATLRDTALNTMGGASNRPRDFQLRRPCAVSRNVIYFCS
jgi:hypothetical protein